jgi:dGTPase
MKHFKDCLKHKAFDPTKSRGRRNIYPDDDSVYFDCIEPFRLCTHKILNSKARRRGDDKTQVLCDPENPHIRTRSRHTNEVVSLSTKIAEITGLNPSLCEAIAQGHDIGHAPYGHMTENFITRVTGKNFKHDTFGVVVAQYIERKGWGMNLSYEVLKGISVHSRGSSELSVGNDLPLEFDVVMFSDKIAYTFSDVNDAIRCGHFKEIDFPKEVLELGKNQRERTFACLKALIAESAESGKISFSKSEVSQKFLSIRNWMYENYYRKVNWSVQKAILAETYEFLSHDAFFEGCDPAIVLALMTDRELNELGNIFLRGRRPGSEDIRNFSIAEIIPFIRGKNINFTDPDLNW